MKRRINPTPPNTPEVKLSAITREVQTFLLYLPMVTPRQVPSVQLLLQMADRSITLGPT